MVSQEQLILAGEIKARKCRQRQPVRPLEQNPENFGELPHKESRKRILMEVFRKIEKRAPREEVFQDAGKLCQFQVKAAEICRGTDRFRLPKGEYVQAEIPLRQTFVLHRHTGEVEELGAPEEWQKLARTHRTKKSKPAKLCLTVFGKPRESASVTSPSAMPSTGSNVPEELAQKRSGDEIDESIAKRHRSGETDSQPKGEPQSDNVGGDGEYDQGYPPKGVSQHGPKFLELKKDERDWLKRVHHRMGHPDPGRFARFLKDTHADPQLVAGALDFQCDACSESRQGYLLSRPAAIHKNLGFNEVVGLDKAFWTNDGGVTFGFFHVLDEGTLFHLGRPCGDDAASQIQCFDDLWMSWAGPPKEVYLDPATEYTGGAWLNYMQGEDIALKMTAADSHWQLGRVESHGHVIKRMLDRMNLQKPILDTESFGKALRQAFTAKNSMSRVHGYTPEQAVLGFARRLPASIVSSEGTASHALALDEGADSDKFRHSLELRCSARKAFVEADNCSSLRRALLRRSRPLKEPYEIGDWVLYWKRVGGNMRRERGRWYGPARVTMTEGSKVIWLSHANKLIRASPEQLRPASHREWKKVLQSEEAKHTTREWLSRAQYQDFFDLGDDIPDAQDVVQLDDGVCDDTSLPEPEQVPSTPSESEGVAVLPELNPKSEDHVVPGTENDPLTAPIPEAAPGELSGEETAMFGDCLFCDGGDSRRVWEIDITPESVDSSFGFGSGEGCTADEYVFLVSEMRKKRVEVKLRDLGEHDQRLFAAAKNKEIGAWLHHKTVRRVVGGKLPEHALMRCRWILN